MKKLDLNKFNLNEVNLSSLNMKEINEKFSHFADKIKQDAPFQKKIGICSLLIIAFLVGANLINDFQQGKIEEASSKQSEYETIQSFLKGHNNRAEEYKNSIAQVHGKLIEQNEIDKADMVIAKLAEADGLTITSNKKAQKADNVGNNIYAQSTALTVEGTYGNIVKFVNDIENEEFFASITNLSIDGKTAKKETPDIISAKVDYRIFYSNAKDSGKASSDKDKAEKSK